jgi:hypothetical protein
MIRHLVFFKKHPEISREDFEQALSGLPDLDTKIPEVKSWWFEFGPSGDRHVEAAIVSEFETAEDLQAYIVHPAHQEVVAKIREVCTTSIFDAEI